MVSASARWSDAPVVVMERTTGDETGKVDHVLRFLFLGCEAKPPYGPYHHTASLFLDLITKSLQKLGAYQHQIILDVYFASQSHLPPRADYSKYDGVILPGSFSAAYEEESWILELSKVIQEELVKKEIPTLGVCFGHQIYAHSFGTEGAATKCPAGPQAGRQTSQLSEAGKRWLSFSDSEGFDLFYTHGDMVEKLPPRAICLGGASKVPTQAAIYMSKTDPEKPIAITFQAHPEYAVSKETGVDGTLIPILKAMNDRNDITNEELQEIEKDVIKEFDSVQAHSIHVMIQVGILLGWFPSRSNKEP